MTIRTITLTITETETPDGKVDVDLRMVAIPDPDPNSIGCQIALAMRERFLEVVGLQGGALRDSQN